jgi:hypothetical protein
MKTLRRRSRPLARHGSDFSLTLASHFHCLAHGCHLIPRHDLLRPRLLPRDRCGAGAGDHSGAGVLEVSPEIWVDMIVALGLWLLLLSR